MRDDTDLAQRATITKMVETYDREVSRVKRSYKALGSAERNLESVFGKEYSDFSVFPDSTWHNQDLQQILIKLKCNAWRSIVNRLQIRKFMSVKAWKDLDKKLEDSKKMPALTVQNVADIIATYEQRAMEFLEEAIREVYDQLRPHDGYSGAKYVTNQKNAKYDIGAKIILTNMVHMREAHASMVDYDDEQLLISLDRVFSHMDGFNIQEGYKSPLVDAINTAPGRLAETDFFRVKCYMNGNLHLEFKRLELLKKFNAVAGGANIMPVNKE